MGGASKINGQNNANACSLEVILPDSLNAKLLEKGWYVTRDNYLHDPFTQTGIDLRGDSNPNRKVIFSDGPDTNHVFIETDECDCGVHYYLINLRNGDFQEVANLYTGAQTLVSSGNPVPPSDLIAQVLDNKHEVNPVYSMFSVRSAFRLLALGLNDSDYNDLATKIGLNPNKTAETSNAKRVNQSLADQSDVIVKISNWAYDQTPPSFKTAYKTALQGLAQIANLDFTNNPEEAIRTINSQVNKDTNGLIPKLVDGDLVDADTAFVLTNALYFKGQWKNAFNKESTRSASFTPLSGAPVSVPMMSQKNEFLYSDVESFQAVSLPYQGDRFSMVVVLPKAGSYFIPSESDYSGLINDMERKKVQVYLPRFSVESSIPLDSVVTDLGLDGKDYSGLTSAHVEQVKGISKVVFKVDEEGSEGAAATALSGTKSISVNHDPVFNADHTFYYAIVDKETGTVLFQGRMDDPTQK